MQKLLRTVDAKRGVVQITCVDERWYAIPGSDPTSLLPIYDYLPSVTWICDFWPKGVGFYKWLASVGWDEAQALKEAGGIRGTKVDTAIKDLLRGLTVKMDDAYVNPKNGLAEALTLIEYDACLAFGRWHATRPAIQIIAIDLTLWSLTRRFAGTLDFCFIEDVLINGQLQRVVWIVDVKTSQAVYMGHRLQVSAYRHTEQVEALLQEYGGDLVKLAILQVGYTRNAEGYKFTEVPDKFPQFLSAQAIWAEECAGQVPLQKDYPVSVTLSLPEPSLTHPTQEA